MKEMKLKLVQVADFRKSERTNLVLTLKKEKLKLTGSECILFISKTGNQLVFVYNYTEVGSDENPRTILHSERLRLSRGTWNPLMLANYAEKVGVNLIGIKRFEEHYKRLVRG